MVALSDNLHQAYISVLPETLQATVCVAQHPAPYNAACERGRLQQVNARAGNHETTPRPLDLAASGAILRYAQVS